jgi:sirohydrochlorin ferrochelatase
VDLPAILATINLPATLADVLGPSEPGTAPDPWLMAALRRRLSELDTSFDGLVLLAAGTSDVPARSTVEAVAAQLGRQLNVACVAGYASASASTPGVAVAALLAMGARRIVAASYFLAPGRLYSAAAAAARAGGALDVAAPLGTADELVRLIVDRATAFAGAAAPLLAAGNTSR